MYGDALGFITNTAIFEENYDKPKYTMVFGGPSFSHKPTGQIFEKGRKSPEVRCPGVLPPVLKRDNGQWPFLVGILFLGGCTYEIPLPEAMMDHQSFHKATSLSGFFRSKFGQVYSPASCSAGSFKPLEGCRSKHARFIVKIYWIHVLFPII